VTFESDLRLQADGTVAPATQIQSTGWVTHPTFRDNPAKAYDDVGVVHLAQPAAGRAPIQLPPAGYLDAQGARGGLRGHVFETVGYGTNGVDRSVLSPRAQITWFGKRFVSTSPFMSLTPYFLKLLGNTNATGLGGGCFGDSGGPPSGRPGASCRSRSRPPATQPAGHLTNASDWTPPRYWDSSPRSAAEGRRDSNSPAKKVV
jgi:hypothetical protein